MKQCIVVADDDPTIVTLVSLRLETDYEVVAAHSGDEALRQIRSHSAHAAILDVQMPGLDGLATLEKIKSDPATAGMPVMILTGERNPETVLQALSVGAADYMVKPFDPDMMAERVARMIRNNPVAAAAVVEL